MKINQSARQEQSLHLSAAMQQSLKCLQMSTMDLIASLQDMALSNPLLEFDSANLLSTAEEFPRMADTFSFERWREDERDKASDEERSPLPNLAQLGGQTLEEYLTEQLHQMHLPDNGMLSECLFLVGCLDEHGYLDCELSDLANEFHYPIDRLEQALYAIQSLDPPGVGARDLPECLLLQLMHGSAFDELTVHIVKYGLELLAKKDYLALSRCFHASKKDVMRSANAIFALNPLPSRGFGSDAPLPVVFPDVLIRRTGDVLLVELKQPLRQRLAVNETYARLLKEELDANDANYIRTRLSEARAIIQDVKQREDTLLLVVKAVVSEQREFFLCGAPLKPLTMRALADRLNLHPSTVSRSVHDKNVQFENRIIPLHSLFSSAVSVNGMTVSSDFVKQRIATLIDSENPDAPFTDEALCQLLEKEKIHLSRKSISNYRRDLHIPAATYRKNKLNTGKI